MSSLGAAKSSLGDSKSSLGDSIAPSRTPWVCADLSRARAARAQKPDKVFLEAYNSIEGHAALKPHNAKLKELFARTRDHFTEEADTAADCEVAPPQADAKEARMSNWQWRMFCEWQGIVGADKLSMNAVMLAFVQVSRSGIEGAPLSLSLFLSHHLAMTAASTSTRCLLQLLGVRQRWAVRVRISVSWTSVLP
jgi:hypothetical protein